MQNTSKILLTKAFQKEAKITSTIFCPKN